MHVDQIEVSTAQAAELIAAQFPALADEPVMPIESAGTVNRIFRVGATHAARFPLVPGTPTQDATRLREEQDAMAGFAAVAGVTAPLPAGVGAPGAGYPSAWTLQTWVHGRTATVDEPVGLAYELAGMVRRLRTVPTVGRCFDGEGRGGELRRHDDWVESCISRSTALVDVDHARRTWAELRELPREDPDVMSHRDLTPGNVLVGDGQLVGVLDTGGFGPADPALDLVAAWHLFDAPARAAFREALDCGDLEWARGRAWALEQALGAAWYYRGSNPAMHELGISTLRRVLDA